VDHPNIKIATSIIDYIFRVLGMEYLGHKHYLHKQDEPVPQNATTSNEHLAKMMGDAPLCNECGHTTVRNGTCYRCLNCGNSMGCS
jgi:ribonucleoside-diphosphate reductase alpha chain